MICILYYYQNLKTEGPRLPRTQIQRHDHSTTKKEEIHANIEGLTQ